MKRHCWIFFLLCLLISCNPSRPRSFDQKDLVWISEDGGERNQYLYFKKSVHLSEGEKIQSANLHLYADSRYALYVNGRYMGFGPARSFHTHPYYDTYDLSNYLVPGENCIVAKVLNNGMMTFQLFDYHGAFAAWGKLQTNHKEVSFQSLEWKIMPSKGYDKTAPRFSFAAGPIENWDSTLDTGWLDCGELKNLPSPVVLKNASNWGDFAPRPIPQLTHVEVLAQPYRNGFYLSEQEELHSFRHPVPDMSREDYSTNQSALLHTQIYSPKNQIVEMGLWWGNYYLNNEPIRDNQLLKENTYRKTYALHLKKGWNSFVSNHTILWGTWDFYMAFPKKANLKLAVDAQENSATKFRYVVTDIEKGKQIEAADYSREDELFSRFEGKWIEVSNDVDANQPARDLAWLEPDTTQVLPHAQLKRAPVILTPRGKGVSLFYKMDEIQLGQFFVEGKFPEGTKIDIGFSEELDPEGYPWLYKRYQIGAGLRFVADGTTQRFTSFKPYGAKFLQVNFTDFTEPIQLNKVGMLRMVYPFETKGSFYSNDTIMNKIYEAGWRTLQLCAEDSYTDTPFRERGLYAGDIIPEMAITMAMSGEMRLVEHSLRIFQDMYHEEMYEGVPNRHNDYPWITLLAADYLMQYTGNESYKGEFYENYKALAMNYLKKYKQPDGLIFAEKVFIEWTNINKQEAAMTAYQSVVYKSLTILEEWALSLDKKEDAVFFSKEAIALKEKIISILWNEEKSAFHDGIKEDNLIEDYHITSTIWPMLYGVLPQEKHQKALSRIITEIQDIGLVSRKRKITTYSSFYLLALLYDKGEVEQAERFMKKHWTAMALHSDRPTTWENFDIDGQQGTSSHAWSGHPTYFMATEVLGVNLGYQRSFNPKIIEISPNSVLLDEASGSVAHPSGVVGVSWKVVGSQLKMKVRVPKGVPTTIIPRGRLATLELVLDRQEY